MAYALVGTGPVGSGVSGAAFTPGLGTLPRTAGHLLVSWAFLSNATTLLGPAGWTFTNGGPSGVFDASVAWKVAAGGDAAPTWPAAAGGVWTAGVGEFSGNSTVADPSDRRFGSSTLGAGSMTATDTQLALLAGELIVSVGGLHYTASAARTLTQSYNQGAGDNNLDNNNGTAALNHRTFDWGIMTVNNADPSATLAFTGTPGSGHLTVVTFQLAVATVPERTMVGVGM